MSTTKTGEIVITTKAVKATKSRPAATAREMRFRLEERDGTTVMTTPGGHALRADALDAETLDLILPHNWNRDASVELLMNGEVIAQVTSAYVYLNGFVALFRAILV